MIVGDVAFVSAKSMMRCTLRNGLVRALAIYNNLTRDANFIDLR